MAYMNQEKKAKIAAELKKVIPQDWRYSLSVKHHSTISLTILAGPSELLGDSRSINTYYLERRFSGELLETFKKIDAALNLDNFDNSDIQSDYFHVGHYADISIGRWDKPYQVLSN